MRKQAFLPGPSLWAGTLLWLHSASLWFPISGLARLLLEAEHPVSRVPGTVLGTGLMYALKNG